MLRVKNRGIFGNKLRIHRRTLGALSVFVLFASAFYMVQTVQNAYAGTDPWMPGASTQIESRLNGSCAIAAGKAYCWGGNFYGGLGNDSTTASSVPVAVDTSGVLAGKTVTSISAGDYSTCAIADGEAYCWGYNAFGQLGNNSTTNSSVPVAVDTSGVLAGKTVTSISAAANHSCAIADGQAYCWGGNWYGQLGNNSTTNSSVPVAVDTSGVLAGKTLTSISTGYDATCAIADGQAFCWGYNYYGKFGNNSTTNSSVPVAVDTSGVLAGKTVSNISVGDEHTCAIADSQAYCWGHNEVGNLGNNSTTDSLVPVAVDASGVLAGKTVTSISAGYANTCAIADGKAYCWGFNLFGASGSYAGSTLGNNGTTVVAVDASGVLAGKTVTSISAGEYHSCAIASGSAYCWGYDQDGRLGNGQDAGYAFPPVVVGFPMFIPQISSLSSNEALADGAMKTIYIYGQDFEPGVTVKFGDIDATVENNWETGMQVSVPTSGVTQTKTVDVTVTNSDGKTAVLPNGFTFVHPTVLPNKFKSTFGESGSGNGQFGYPEGIAVAANGNVFITDSANDKVQIFTAAGVYVSQFGSSGTGQGQFDYPTAIDIGPDGNVYVVDTSNNRVEVFDQNGQYMRQFGSAGFGNGKFDYAEGMAVNSQGNVYVSECGYDNNTSQSYSRVHVFKNDGTFLRSFGSDGTGNGEFDCTYGIAIDKSDNVYVVDANNYRIQVFDKNDNFIRKFGSRGVGEGQFNWIEDLTVDQSGNVLVTDSGNNRIQVFNKDGAYVGQIGKTGTGSGDFDWPNSIAVGLNGDLYISDGDNYRIQVFEGMPQLAPVSQPVSQPNTSTPKGNKKTVPEAVAANEDNGKTELEQSITVNGETPLTSEPIITKRPTFSGIASPFAEVVVTIHSDPVVCKTTADADGRWSCTLDQDLPAGTHHVTVELTNQDGTKTTLGPYAVTVKGGDTINSSQVAHQRPSASSKRNGSGFVPSYIIAAIGLIVVVLLVFIMFIRKRAKIS